MTHETPSPNTPPDDPDDLRLSVFSEFLSRIDAKDHEQSGSEIEDEVEGEIEIENDEGEIVPTWSGVEISHELFEALNKNQITPDLAEELLDVSLNEERLDLLTEPELKKFHSHVQTEMERITHETGKVFLHHNLSQTSLLLDTLKYISDTLVDWARQKPQRDLEFIFAKPVLDEAFEQLEEEAEMISQCYPHRQQEYKEALEYVRDSLGDLSKFNEASRGEVMDIKREMLELYQTPEIFDEPDEDDIPEVFVDHGTMESIVAAIRELSKNPDDFDEDGPGFAH